MAAASEMMPRRRPTIAGETAAADGSRRRRCRPRVLVRRLAGRDGAARRRLRAADGRRARAPTIRSISTRSRRAPRPSRFRAATRSAARRRPRATRPAKPPRAGEPAGEDNVTEINGAGGEEESRRIGRRRRRDGGSARAHAAPAPAVQDPGGDQAPAGHAGAGRQGGARHQGRGAHHLSVARRPLFGADAQHRARRRHQPQDHQLRGPQAAQGDRAGAGGAGRHGRDPAHRRRQPHQDRGQARLRISAAAVGDGARPDAEIDRADAGLRGRLAGQALDPRPLQQGHRRDPGRRRRRLPRGERLHAHAHAEPCQEREALSRERCRSSPASASRASSTPCSSRWCSCAPAATS